MHFAGGKIPGDYLRYTRIKVLWIIGGVILLCFLLISSISAGAVNIPPIQVINSLTGHGISPKWDLIIWNIRLPRVLTSIVAGIGLSVAGVAMQSVLRNPLGSPFTLGISNAGAFGAAISVILLGSGQLQAGVTDGVTITNPYVTTIVAFTISMIATGVILLISQIKAASPEVMILTGVALSSLFTAGTMFLQYFATDTQLAAVVFWTFGDTGRASWGELGLMTVVVGIASVYFFCKRWDYNAVNAGDEVAKGLGVDTGEVRICGMTVASLVSATIVSFLGVIGFVGLVCPHMVRRIIGDDQRYLLPGSCVMGGILLLASDTMARLILAPIVLPVSILTAFMGAPIFVYLILKGYK